MTDYSFFENLKYENYNSYLGLCLELDLKLENIWFWKLFFVILFQL